MNSSNPQHSSGRNTKRYSQLDVLRGITVLLAMLDHVKIQFVSDFHLFVPATRLATPCFIILFGAMIEIAYLAKFRAGADLPKIKHRIVTRFVTCWGLAILLSFVAVLSGNLGFQAGWQSVFGLAFGRFNEIFLIYAALFVILLAIWPVLSRYGSVPVLIIAAAGWLAQPWWGIILGEPTYASSFFLGYGPGYGPGLLPAMTFLGFGIAVGEFLTGRRGPAIAVAILVVACAVILSELSFGLMEAGRRFLANRWINHPGYFAVGIVAFAGMALTITAATKMRILAPTLDILARIGGQTLFVYAMGNLVLNALPQFDLPRVIGMPVALAFLIGLSLLALMGHARRNTAALGIPLWWSRTYARLLDSATQRLFQRRA
ncbi:OpgC domain-containing protein [Thalassococcus lentus]|uniref:OpgC domain-containing protein n=1 Tax=Thalassococcus lentus TaxID=1210524 RepID=A0ABT4XRC3_9RHOB|nr:OpgC domain-containing protein [Thalassococcus lentus]MDA7424496.1 OpgC domain-containing protein [Thalassococcus lentus]